MGWGGLQQGLGEGWDGGKLGLWLSGLEYVCVWVKYKIFNFLLVGSTERVSVGSVVLFLASVKSLKSFRFWGSGC